MSIGEALKVDLSQSLKLITGWFIHNPLHLSGLPVVPPEHKRNARIRAQIDSFSRRAERVKNELELVRYCNANDSRLGFATALDGSFNRPRLRTYKLE